MEKTLQDSLEKSMEEWEFLPENSSFIEFGLDDIKNLVSNEVIYTDYFREVPKLIQETPAEHSKEVESQIEDVKIPHVFFKMTSPMDEGLVELRKLRSDRSDLKQSASELVVQGIEAPPPAFVMEERVSVGEEGEEEEEKEEEEEEEAIWEGIDIGIWRCKLTGVSALCSIGAAAVAAALFSLLLGGREGKAPQCRRRHHNNIVRFRINADEKTLSKVVEHASRMNHALAAARGTPTMMQSAAISFGGCCDNL